MSRRRERRTAVAMPVVMQPMQEEAAPLSGCTLDVTHRGARVQLQSEWEPGEMIWVERRGKRAQFRVVWVGEAGTAKQRQIGIECVDPAFDWGVELPRETATADEEFRAASARAGGD